MASVLTGDPPAIQMFDVAVEEARKQLDAGATDTVPETTANLMCNELFALARDNESQKTAEEIVGEGSLKFSKVSGEQLGEVVALLVEGVISNTMAKKLLKILYNEEQGKSPKLVAKDRGFELITDAEELTRICHDVIADSPEEMERYKLGEKFARKITKFLQGKAMAASKGNAHPERLREVLFEVLEEVVPEDKSR